MASSTWYETRPACVVKARSCCSSPSVGTLRQTLDIRKIGGKKERSKPTHFFTI